MYFGDSKVAEKFVKFEKKMLAVKTAYILHTSYKQFIFIYLKDK